MRQGRVGRAGIRARAGGRRWWRRGRACQACEACRGVESVASRRGRGMARHAWSRLRCLLAAAPGPPPPHAPLAGVGEVEGDVLGVGARVGVGQRHLHAHPEVLQAGAGGRSGRGPSGTCFHAAAIAAACGMHGGARLYTHVPLPHPPCGSTSTPRPRRASPSVCTCGPAVGAVGAVEAAAGRAACTHTHPLPPHQT